MLFNSVQFLIFFPIVLLVYYVIPQKVRYIWLLVCSYYFYMCWNARYVLLLFASTGATWLCGILIEQIKVSSLSEQQKTGRKRLMLILSLVFNLGILFYFKYFEFAFWTLSSFLKVVFHVELSEPAYDVVLPVGISFYIFQALGYTIDVYRDDIHAERNFLRYALFVSFFPQLVAGPIERSGNLLHQLSVPAKWNFDRFRDGILLMLWGYFLKIVLADRITQFVDPVYGDIERYGGWYLLIATVLFGVQIYCDFAGYSTIAMGAAEILGIQLMENFNAPYLSRGCGEFWRRWHISLSSWFRDYVYIPLGGSRKGKRRTCLNTLIVFTLSGLWHGADWTYVFWGFLNGIYVILGRWFRGVRLRMESAWNLTESSHIYHLVQMLVTFLMVDFSWIFFRAETFSGAMSVIRSMFTIWNPWILFDGTVYSAGPGRQEFLVMVAGIIILLVADICRYKGITVRNVIERQALPARAFCIAFSIILILQFGIWGPGYRDTNFIYFQF